MDNTNTLLQTRTKELATHLNSLATDGASFAVKFTPNAMTITMIDETGGQHAYTGSLHNIKTEFGPLHVLRFGQDRAFNLSSDDTLADHFDGIYDMVVEDVAQSRIRAASIFPPTSKPIKPRM